MTDMRRTFLWGVFIFSLFMLYDGWNRHTGQPSIFAPPPPVATPAAPATDTATSPPVVVGSTAVPGATTVASTVPAVEPAIAAEQVTITTDLVQATTRHPRR